MVPGKKIELNEGMRLLTGKSRIDIPLKKKEEPKSSAAPAPVGTPLAPSDMMPMTTKCTVVEGGNSRCFMVTVESATAAQASPGTPAATPAVAPVAPVAPAAGAEQVPVYSSFAGSVELVDIMVKAGDTVTRGQAVAAVEAMKATHEIKSSVDGVVASVHASIGDEVDNTKPIITISKTA
jgi:biotin carboxyl carrier protein